MVPRTPMAMAWAKNSTPTTTHAYDGSRSRSSATAAPPVGCGLPLLGWKAPPGGFRRSIDAAAVRPRRDAGLASPLSSDAMGAR